MARRAGLSSHHVRHQFGLAEQRAEQVGKPAPRHPPTPLTKGGKAFGSDVHRRNNCALVIKYGSISGNSTRSRLDRDEKVAGWAGLKSHVFAIPRRAG